MTQTPWQQSLWCAWNRLTIRISRVFIKRQRVTVTRGHEYYCQSEKLSYMSIDDCSVVGATISPRDVAPVDHFTISCHTCTY
mmetsp:Transcript_38963/g.47175  ORF Transcript_38963/g.47175 Transcript_38963/m.47175 type:complete len:82 (+) Transcript_38963:284-529(+)